MSDREEKNEVIRSDANFEHDKAEEMSCPEAEFLKDAPPEVRKIMMSMQRMSGPMPHPLSSKINEKHIDKILELAEKDDERAFGDTSQSRRYTFAYLALFSALFVFATVFLVGKDTELYKELLKLLAMFAGGLGSGFGIKSYMDKKS